MERRMDQTEIFKGRGATRNPPSRFDATVSEPVDDGWTVGAAQDDDFFPQSAPETRFLPDQTRQIIAKNASPDIPFEQSINPFKGCEHGCVYCYARPTHAYLDLSPGLDFETKIFFKTEPVKRLKEVLDKPGYEPKTIAFGTNTDPYQPAERRFRITRQLLETLLEYRHPVSIVTKGGLILRDLDVLSALAEEGLVSVAISITTLDNELKTKLEPRTASPGARLRAVKELSDAGVPVGVMMAPVIPFLNDGEIESIVDKSMAAGAFGVNYVMIRLPLEVADLFDAWLREHYPLKADRILERIRDLRGGALYRSRFGERMRGTGVYADLIAKRFEVALRAHDVTGMERVDLATDRFRAKQKQFELF